MLVDGYVRNQNKLWEMNIPSDINRIIYSFYKLMILSDILTNEESQTLYDMILKQLECDTINFELIYCGTKDGFGFEDFRKKCYDIKQVMVICETMKDIVCGGYTSIGFIYGQDLPYKDENAFLYSIRTNDRKYPPKIFPVLKGEEEEAMESSSGSHLFGFANSGIWLAQYCNKPDTNSGIAGLGYISSSIHDDYLNAGDSDYLVQIKELEVFKLTF